MEDYNEAIKYFNKALEIEEDGLLSKDLMLTHTLLKTKINIATIIDTTKAIDFNPENGTIILFEVIITREFQVLQDWLKAIDLEWNLRM